jgi:hypothetical protein
MQKLVALVVVVASALLAGCAGSSAIVQSEYRLAQGETLRLQLAAPPSASEEGVSILRERLTLQLSDSGLLATTADVSPRTIEVTVTNYYMRHGATRAMVGIMAGADNIQSTVKVKDPVSGKILSEFTVESKNPSAWGTSRGLIEGHADKVVETLRSMKR